MCIRDSGTAVWRSFLSSHSLSNLFLLPGLFSSCVKLSFCHPTVCQSLCHLHSVFAQVQLFLCWVVMILFSLSPWSICQLCKQDSFTPLCCCCWRAMCLMECVMCWLAENVTVKMLLKCSVRKVTTNKVVYCFKFILFYCAFSLKVRKSISMRPLKIWLWPQSE